VENLPDLSPHPHCSTATTHDDNIEPGNHTGYRQVAGTKSSAEEIHDIYQGLKRSYLTDFDVLLSGYAPSADAVQAVSVIAHDLRAKAAMKPGSFFWGMQGIQITVKIGNGV
jgi:hypothetical protein